MPRIPSASVKSSPDCGRTGSGTIVDGSWSSPDEASKVLRLLQCLVEGKTSNVPVQSIVAGGNPADAVATKGNSAGRTEPALEEIKPRFERIKISQDGSNGDFELDQVRLLSAGDSSCLVGEPTEQDAASSRDV